MFAGSVIRKLAPSEEFYAKNETFAAVTVYLAGPFDIDAMATAFDTLIEIHPVYAGHLELDSDGRYQIVSDDLLHPGIWVAEPGAASAATSESGAASAAIQLDQSVALLNLMVKPAGEQTEVTLFAHHSLADGIHIAGLLLELFSRYTAVVTRGDPGPVIPQPAPEPIETLLEQRGVRKLQRSGLDRFIPAMFAYELPPRRPAITAQLTAPVALPVARGRLTKSETTALVRLGRKHRLFANSLVSAAILLAEWRLRETPHIPIPYLFPVDLRGILEPPVSPTGCTLALGVSTYLARISSDTSIVDLARDIADTLQADLSDGVVQQSMLHFSLQDELIPGMPDFVVSTNRTSMFAMPAPPGVEVVDFESQVYRISPVVIDVYPFGIAAGELHLEHHVDSAAPETSVELILSLLRSAALDCQL